jgi:hypothetical protein
MGLHLLAVPRTPPKIGMFDPTGKRRQILQGRLSRQDGSLLGLDLL